MLPTTWEYLFAVLLLLALGLSAFWDAIVIALQKRYVWKSLAIYLLYCCGIEALGLTQGWWRFHPDHVLGLSILSVPLEEFLLFIAFFLITLGAFQAGRYESN